MKSITEGTVGEAEGNCIYIYIYIYIHIFGYILVYFWIYVWYIVWICCVCFLPHFGEGFGKPCWRFLFTFGLLVFGKTMLVSCGLPFLHRIFEPLKTSSKGGRALPQPLSNARCWWRLVSVGFAWIRLVSVSFTWVSLSFTWTHLVSLDVAWTHLILLRSYGLT